jgi:uncharacterized protein YnzC (UPF0291/DUF896 family)
VARSNFPREDEESKFKRGQTRVVNQLVEELRQEPINDLEILREAYLQGWKAAVKRVIRLNQSPPKGKTR